MHKQAVSQSSSLPPHHSHPLLIWSRTSLRVCIAFQPNRKKKHSATQVKNSWQFGGGIFFFKKKQSVSVKNVFFFSFNAPKILLLEKLMTISFFEPHSGRSFSLFLWRGEEQNREEGEVAQKKVGGGRNRGQKQGGGRKCEVNVQRGGRNQLKKQGGETNWLRKQGEGRFTPLFLPPPCVGPFPPLGLTLRGDKLNF